MSENNITLVHPVEAGWRKGKVFHSRETITTRRTTASEMTFGVKKQLVNTFLVYLLKIVPSLALGKHTNMLLC